MSPITCELCGSTDFLKQEGAFVCQSCGMKYSVDEAKKLLGTVKIDRTEEVEKLLLLARRARKDRDSENAEKYYEMVLREKPNNWEAAYFQVYFRVAQCKIADIESAANKFANCIGSTMELVAKLKDDNEKDYALSTVVRYSIYLAEVLAKAAKSHYREHSEVDGVSYECSCRVAAVYGVYLQIENELKRCSSERVALIVSVQKQSNQFLRDYDNFFDLSYRMNHMNRLTAEIKLHEPSYERPAPPKSGCYVATAVYGSYNCPQVWTLRRYRDYTLAETWYGRAFIRTYYAISPTLVKWFGHTEWFKKMWKGTLDRMVKNLNDDGVENTPYEDKNW